MQARTLLLLLLYTTFVAVFFLADAVHGVSFPCNCNSGTINASEPWCVCDCNEGFLGPDCAFTATDTVVIQVWYNYPISAFVSALAVATLNAQLATSTVIFDYASGSFNQKTMAVYDMDGRSAYNLQIAVNGNMDWTVAANITAVYLQQSLMPAAAPQTVLYENGPIIITVSGVAFFVAAIVVLALLLLLDKVCCGAGRRNTSATIQHDIQHGLWDPQLGKDPVLPFRHLPKETRSRAPYRHTTQTGEGSDEYCPSPGSRSHEASPPQRAIVKRAWEN